MPRIFHLSVWTFPGLCNLFTEKNFQSEIVSIPCLVYSYYFLRSEHFFLLVVLVTKAK